MHKRLPPLYQLVTLFIGIVWTLYSLQFLEQGIFWDLAIYEKAVTIFNSGGNPYDLNGYLSFVYHPLVLRFLALFGNHLGIALVGSYVMSVLFFLKSLGKNQSWWIYSFLAFAYCGIGTVSIGSGNVTVFFHLTLLGILLRWVSGEQEYLGNSERPIGIFILMVMIFSIVKPYMLAYLLIPVIVSWKTPLQKSTWALTLFASLLLALILLFGSLYFDTEFQSFLSAVQGQTIGKRDLGYGLVMYFYDYYLSAGPLIYRAFVLHFAILAIIILMSIILAKRSKSLNKASFALLLYFLLTILNPRLKVYDLFPALIALFIFISYLKQTVITKAAFVFAYALSLSQLAGTPLFANTGILSDPLNIYYLTMGLLLIAALPLFSKNTTCSLNH
jgi:hypothetical protein